MYQDVGVNKEVGNLFFCVLVATFFNRHIAKLRVSLSQENNNTVAVYMDVFQVHLIIVSITQVM
jgi:hypothetical protein